MVHGVGRSTPSGLRFQTTILQCRPHAATLALPAPHPPTLTSSLALASAFAARSALIAASFSCRTASCSGVLPFCATRPPVSQAHSAWVLAPPATDVNAPSIAHHSSVGTKRNVRNPSRRLPDSPHTGCTTWSPDHVVVTTTTHNQLGLAWKFREQGLSV